MSEEMSSADVLKISFVNGMAMAILPGIAVLFAVAAYHVKCDEVKALKAEVFQLHQRNLLLSGGHMGSDGFVVPPSPYPKPMLAGNRR